MTDSDVFIQRLSGPVVQRMAAQPTLAMVACDLLRSTVAMAIKEAAQPEALTLGTSLWRTSGDEQTFIGYALQPLAQVVYQRYLTGVPIDLYTELNFVTEHPGSEYPRHLTANLRALAEEIDLIGPFIVDAWCDRLAAFWGQPGPDGQSPWAWLADDLRRRASHGLRAATVAGTVDSAHAPHVAMALGLRPVDPQARHPEEQAWQARLVFAIEWPVPMLLIERSGPTPAWVLYSPNRGFASFDRLAALTAYLGQTDAGFEPAQGEEHPLTQDIFGAWAGAILDGHLARQRARAVEMRNAHADPATFEAVMNTFPAALLLDNATHAQRSEAISSRLPQWLSQASDPDRLRYGLALRQVLQAQQASAGMPFLAGIPTVQAYARRRLIEQAAIEHPEAPLHDPDDVVVSIFSRSDDALISIAGGGGTVTLEEQKISLVDLSLLNTGGRPPGWMEVAPRPGKTLPAWLDDTSALALVQAIDVGSSYLGLLRGALSIGPQAARRRQVFKATVAAQVPLLALELKLRGESGVDEAGIALVRRAFSGTPQGARPMVARLALEATPGAAPDVVAGMFVLFDPAVGSTTVLYTPLGREPLRQFPQRAALMDAIVAEPELRHTVLTWLSDTAQARYRDGGLQAPHWLRFGLGDEFAPAPAIAPARLMPVAVEGDPLDALYDGVVQAITLAADRQSVSNRESFWISARELGWLLFNQTLPFISGTAATAAWLIQLGHSLDEHYNAADATEVSDAFSNEELIFVLILALLTEGANRALTRGLPDIAAGTERARSRALVPELDTRWATAVQTLTPQLRERLEALVVQGPAELPSPVPSGPFRGLVLVGKRWLAQVDGRLFEVTPGDGEAVVLDPAAADRQGPWLRRDESGRWRLDLRLRLRGGGPKRRLEQQRQLNEQLRAQADQHLRDIEQNYRHFRQGGEESERVIDNAVKAGDLATARARRISEQHRLEEAFDNGVRLRDAYEAIGKKVALSDYSRHLSTALGGEINICGSYLYLSRERLLDNLKAHSAFSSSGEAGFMNAQQAREWFAFLHEHIESAEAAELWRARLEERLSRLAEIPVFGPRLLAQFKPKFSSLRSRVEYQILRLYIQLSLLEEPMIHDDQVRDGWREAMTPLVLGMTTHREIAQDPTLAEGHAVELLDGLISTYQAAEDTVAWLKQTLEPRYVSAGMDQLVERIVAVREEAEGRLSSLIKQTAEQVTAPPTKQPPRKGSGPRLIRTRNRGALVAKVRKVTGQPTEEVAEIVSPLGDTVVARFSHDQALGDWVQQPLGGPRPDPDSDSGTAGQADVERLVQEADRRLESARRQLEQAPRLAQVTRIPLELEELLNNAARDLSSVAERIDRALTRINETDVGVRGYGSAEAKAKALREMAVKLKEEGRALRIRLTKTSLPTIARVRYLVNEGEARIRRLGSRIALKGQGKRKDIVQEYAVQELSGATLWYAHFHYPNLEAEDGQYLAAHLKTPSQRFVGLNTQMAQAASNAEVVKIYRSRIDPVNARELFFVLP
ncbi:DUF6543 domain-containing protein [Pseudomonas sp. RIT-PI-S]|uniref:dermonecrotic toxin domain-containing protein n=1 Tax=Pseudomonas sp. RIT-PI-S TaxID=3035295 RepID=UPI0021DB08A9|nr:DUF6543 domain-containing protein [Pseudomonas sp. RIT-PI-S]